MKAAGRTARPPRIVSYLAIALVAATAAWLPGGASAGVGRTDPALRGLLSIYDFGALSATPTGRALVTSYEALHPGVTIQLVPISPIDAVIAQERALATGTAADLVVSVWAQQVNADVPKGDWVDLTPYLAQPNPYAPGYRRWLDTFVPAAMRQVAFRSRYYVVAPNAQDAMFYYNAGLFEEAGIIRPPTTWAELMDDSARLAQIGLIPDLYYLGDTYGLSENSSILSLLEDQVMAPALRRMDTNHDGVVDLSELVAGIKRHIYSPLNPDYQEAWKLLKDWSRYWQPDAIANLGPIDVPPTTAMTPFLQGRAAMTYAGSVPAGIALRSAGVSFRWGVFAMPPVTSASSPFADPTAHSAGLWGANDGFDWGITASAIRHGTVALAVDFLRYITAPRHDVPLSLDNGVVPTVAGWQPAPGDRSGAMVLDLLGHPTLQFSAELSLGLPWLQQRLALQQQYLTGVISLRQAMIAMQRATDRAADAAIKLYRIA